MDFKPLWLSAAEGWKAQQELIESCKKSGLDPEWCDRKIADCQRNYNFCMLRGTETVKVIGDIKVNENGTVETHY